MTSQTDTPSPLVRHRVLLAVVASILLIAVLLLLLATFRLGRVTPPDNPWAAAAVVPHDGAWSFHWQQSMEREVLPLVHPVYGMIDPGMSWLDESLQRGGLLLMRRHPELPAPHWAMSLTLRRDDITIRTQLEELVELLGAVTPPGAPQPVMRRDERLVVIATDPAFGDEVMAARIDQRAARATTAPPGAPIEFTGPLGALPGHIHHRVRISDTESTTTLYHLAFLPARVIRIEPGPATEYEPMPILVLPSPQADQP